MRAGAALDTTGFGTVAVVAHPAGNCYEVVWSKVFCISFHLPLFEGCRPYSTLYCALDSCPRMIRKVAGGCVLAILMQKSQDRVTTTFDSCLLRSLHGDLVMSVMAGDRSTRAWLLR